MSQSFQISINGVFVTPPSYAMPVWIDQRMPYAPVVVYPMPAGRDGEGYPIRANLELTAKLGRPIINQAGQAWWYTTVGNGFTAGFINRKLILYDPAVQLWNEYSGVLWKPTYGGGSPGHKLFDFVVNVTNLIYIGVG